MLYTVADEVFEGFPGFRRVVVVAKGVDNTQESSELLTMLRACEEDVRGERLTAWKGLPELTAWTHAFAHMGINPNKYPPSIINLIKRVRNGKPLPYVNTLVALFNTISMKYLVPCGGDDASVVMGNVHLGLATGEESYVPLGQPDVKEHPCAGEVIYYDTGTNDVFCRAWCWKNGDRSKLLPQTTHAIINVDAMAPVSLAHIQAAAQELAALLHTYTGAHTTLHRLTPETPACILD